MADLEVDDTLDVFIDKTGDLAYAEGRNAFEQKISIALIDYYHNNSIGENDPDTALESIRVGARRAVQEVGDIEEVSEIHAEFSDTEPNKMLVDIIFDTGEPLTFDI